MAERSAGILPEYPYPATARWFFGGALVTAVFSGSLAVLATEVGLPEVLIVGMLVPSFTWVVQLSAAAVGLPPRSGARTAAILGGLA